MYFDENGEFCCQIEKRDLRELISESDIPRSSFSGNPDYSDVKQFFEEEVEKSSDFSEMVSFRGRSIRCDCEERFSCNICSGKKYLVRIYAHPACGNCKGSQMALLHCWDCNGAGVIKVRRYFNETPLI
jgi:DnaJ-class molecular chaperone